MDAGDFRLHRAERTAILNRREHLWIERLLRRHAAREINIDDGLRGRCGRGATRARSGQRFEPEEISQSEPKAAHHTDIQELAAIWTPDVVRPIAPCGFPFTHSSCLSV